MANLTTKEAAALEDQLGSEQLLIVKSRGLASQCSDAAIKTKLEQFASKHQQHYDRIKSYLN